MNTTEDDDSSSTDTFGDRDNGEDKLALKKAAIAKKERDAKEVALKQLQKSQQ